MDYVYKFTYSELIDKISSLQSSDFAKPDLRSSLLNGKEFTGTKSFKEALSIAQYGWKDSNTVKNISYELDNLIPIPQFRDSFLYDVAGDEPEVSRFLSNEPENMLVFTQEEDTNNKQVHLLVNGTFSSNIDTEIIYNRGACIVTLINKLEDLGFRVKLDIVTVVNCEKSTEDFIKILVEVKDYTDQLDIDRVAFCISHASYLRRIIFSILESLGKKIVNKFEFYDGGRYSLPSDNVSGLSYTLYFESLKSNNRDNYSSLENCKRMVQKQIQEIIHIKNSY